MIEYIYKNKLKLNQWFRLAIAGALLLAFPVGAVEFKEGIHYQAVTKQHAPRVPSGKEVIEFLWYDCKTCYAVQGELKHWLMRKPTVVHYKRLPAVTEQKMEYFARVMVTAQQLKVLDKVNMALFTALHAYKRPLEDSQELERFFGEFGVEAKQFRTFFNSGFVATKVRQAKKLGEDFGITGAPTFVVNGRYRVDPTMVASPQELFQVIDFLLRQ